MQEVLDSILCAYRIAETAMLPVMVCAEGFLLSHTSEALDVPVQAAVDAFLPELRPPDDWVLDPGRARVFSSVPTPREYYGFQRNVAVAMDEARGLIESMSAEFYLALRPVQGRGARAVRKSRRQPGARRDRDDR